MKMRDDDYGELVRLLSGEDLGETMRDRWDAVWRVNGHVDREAVQAWFKKCYLYLNDSHIDTALRKIQRGGS